MDPLSSETCSRTFKYFIILIVSTYYILCISLIIKCLIIIDAQCKHDDWSALLKYAVNRMKKRVESIQDHPTVCCSYVKFQHPYILEIPKLLFFFVLFYSNE